jgi:hypothetical protein
LPPPSGVFRISVTPIPEPSMMSLILMGILFSAGRLRHA